MNNAKVLKKWILFPILVAFVAILNIDNVTAQQAGSAQNTATIQEQSNQPRFYNGVFKADESKFNTTVYTFNDITVFSYFNDTDITITSFAGDTVFSDTLAANGFTTFNANDGIFSISSGKSYTALVGDAVSNLVQGYFAIDQSGRGTSTLLNTYMVGNFQNEERFIVFGYQDNTSFSIKNLVTGDVLFAGVLNEGEHYTMPVSPHRTYLQVSASKPVSALSYGDQDYYVPAANGRFSGNIFYGFSAHIGNWTNSITISSYYDDNIVYAFNSVTGDTLIADTLGQGQVVTHSIVEETYWKVEAQKTVTVANIPYAGWSGNYFYMTRTIDETGIGAGKLFYVPTISSRLDVFSFEDDNDVRITYLGHNTSYPYETATMDTVFEGVLNAGEGYNFTTLSGNNVYKVESTGNSSVLQSNGGAGADFMPLSFAQQLPDLAISEDGLSFTPPDSVFGEGDEVTVSLVVRNFGPVDAENVVVALYDGDISSEGTAPVIGFEEIPLVAAQDSAIISVDFVVPQDPEFRTLSLQVDPEDLIQESNSSNNTIIRPLVPNKDLLPPLPISVTAPSGLEIEEDSLAGNPFKVTANIFNQGTVDAENVVVKIILFDGLTLVGEDSVINEAALPGQESLTVEWMVRADKNVSGPNKYKVTVDADNAEAKEANRSISIPDLVAPTAPSSLSSMISPDNENNITLNWTLNSETDLAGYLVYYGSESGVYDGVDANEGESPITISTFDEFELSGLPNGGSQYFFVIRAFDLSGNVSDPSNESTTTIITDIFDESEVPDKYLMEQNYPNPFNPTTSISYKIPETANVQITLYDMLGRKLSTLVNERKLAGAYQLTLDMSTYSSGIYLYRMQAGNFVQTRRLTLIK
ncbi:MAG: hypothetical protein CL662_06125 [Bacteroidetes bacterium]|jgi:hypothetical protein|nr:hypothetical protein [Bacteroidota bacterium]|tara:strand:+ start:9691 stop:12294 length:2604 start_codon:yes stop_codon:yes gene_type:complete